MHGLTLEAELLEEKLELLKLKLDVELMLTTELTLELNKPDEALELVFELLELALELIAELLEEMLTELRLELELRKELKLDEVWGGGLLGAGELPPPPPPPHAHKSEIVAMNVIGFNISFPVVRWNKAPIKLRGIVG